MDLLSRTARPLCLLCLLFCCSSAAPGRPSSGTIQPDRAPRLVLSGGGRALPAERGVFPETTREEDLKSEQTVYLIPPPPQHFVWHYLRVPQGSHLAPRVVQHQNLRVAHPLPTVLIKKHAHHASGGPHQQKRQHGNSWSAQGSVQKGGHGSVHDQEKGRKGESGSEERKGEYEEGEGRWKGGHNSGGGGGSRGEGHSGGRGAAYEKKKKHDKGGKKAGFQKSHHFDEQHKIRSFYDNFHTEGEHKQFGVYQEKDEGQDHKKQAAHKHNSSEHEDHHGKKGEHHAAKHHDEHSGHSSKDGSEKHHEHEAHHGTKGGKAGSSKHQHSAHHRR